jgi:AmmeMemoRadiSam system protein B
MTMDEQDRPALRSVETIAVPDPEHGRVLVLRDTQGVSEGHAVLPPALLPIVARFTGQLTCSQIAAEVSAQLGTTVPVEVVVRLAEELERGLFLEGKVFRAARAHVEREFAEATVRAASHSGGAYYGEGAKLRAYIDGACLGKAQQSARGEQGTMVALVAPHIDPWRGAVGYGHAYAALAAALPSEADTFLLLGTSHAPMREPFALCRKGFDTPLGVAPADLQAIDLLAEHADGFDPYADQFNHKREHSIEFQAVFLRHLLGPRPFRIVPVLAGLGRHQASGADPARDSKVERFMAGMRKLVESRPGRVVVVAGADMAHVGPRFGDSKAFGAEQRAGLERTDRGSLEYAAQGDASAFWSDVAADLEQRRVCGLAPIWSLLRALPAGTRGQLLHYEQTVDPEDGSIVSHAAMGFYA